MGEKLPASEDMARIRRLSQALRPFELPQSQPESPSSVRKPTIPLATLLFLAFAFFAVLSLGFKSLSRSLPLIPTATSELKLPSLVSKLSAAAETGYSRSAESHTLGGLIHHDLSSYAPCHSRLQHHLYRKASPFMPSRYLITKLRKYEDRHRKCAGQAKVFTIAMGSPQLVKEEDHQETECRFIVWIAWSGLGNRLMTLVSTFLYALLTDRVLLVDRGTDMGDLFCEPFPQASWLLPVEFPQSWLQELNESSPIRFGHLIDKGRCSIYPSVTPTPLYTYIHLTHTFDSQDRRFFCSEEQKLINHIPWLFVRSNNYYVPSLYFVPRLAEEIELMFPEREALFHHLARYLFHPSNEVWSRIMRFYEAYLMRSERVVGIQIRTFDVKKTPLENVTAQVFACAIGNKILPNASTSDQDQEAWALDPLEKPKPISVLVTSLHQEHYERIREFYLTHSVDQGYIVGVHLPSHEEEQKTGKAEHNKQALAEIFLLSLSDTLITSAMSTFGYAAQGLSGLRPWVLTKHGEKAYHHHACIKGLSLEPCFHSPPLFNCDCEGGRDPGKIIPFVRHCEDVHWGLKLFGDTSSITTSSSSGSQE